MTARPGGSRRIRSVRSPSKHGVRTVRRYWSVFVCEWTNVHVDLFITAGTGQAPKPHTTKPLRTLLFCCYHLAGPGLWWEWMAPICAGNPILHVLCSPCFPGTRCTLLARCGSHTDGGICAHRVTSGMEIDGRGNTRFHPSFYPSVWNSDDESSRLSIVYLVYQACHSLRYPLCMESPKHSLRVLLVLVLALMLVLGAGNC